MFQFKTLCYICAVFLFHCYPATPHSVNKSKVEIKYKDKRYLLTDLTNFPIPLQLYTLPSACFFFPNHAKNCETYNRAYFIRIIGRLWEILFWDVIFSVWYKNRSYTLQKCLQLFRHEINGQALKKSCVQGGLAVQYVVVKSFSGTDKWGQSGGGEISCFLAW